MNQQRNSLSNTDSAETLPLCKYVKDVLISYFERLDGDMPVNLYQMFIEQVEHPLLQTVLDYTGNNQSKAANILGISRGTLHKKLMQYKLIK